MITPKEQATLCALTDSHIIWARCLAPCRGFGLCCQCYNCGKAYGDTNDMWNMTSYTKDEWNANQE